MPARSRYVLLSLVLLFTVVSTSVLVDWQAANVEQSVAPDNTALVSPDGTDSYVWPYTSRSRSVSGRTLALNVVVLGDSEQVRRVLVTRSAADWNMTEPNTTIRISPWRPTHGSVRYTYVSSGQNTSGQWVPPDYQLHVGTYFGQRTHLRAYSSRSGNWTAIQAHTEYWDWFRVRHTVTGVPSGGRLLEEDLWNEPFVTNVTRTHHGHRSGGSIGWWTVIGLTPALVIAGSTIRGTGRWTVGDIALPGGLLSSVLGVRFWGLAAEAVFPSVTPKLFVAIGYPILATAPPALVTVLSANRPAKRAGLLTALGFGTALVFDLAFVGVRQIPTQLVYHRVALTSALVVIAIGSARGRRRLVGVGVVAWLAMLAAPLFGLV